MEEATFYGGAPMPGYGGAASAGPMTLNVRAPVQWSEWLRIGYWLLKMTLLAIPVIWIFAKTEAVLTILARFVPLEWRATTIELLKKLQDQLGG